MTTRVRVNRRITKKTFERLDRGSLCHENCHEAFHVNGKVRLSDEIEREQAGFVVVVV